MRRSLIMRNSQLPLLLLAVDITEQNVTLGTSLYSASRRAGMWPRKVACCLGLRVCGSRARGFRISTARRFKSDQESAGETGRARRRAAGGVRPHSFSRFRGHWVSCPSPAPGIALGISRGHLRRGRQETCKRMIRPWHSPAQPGRMQRRHLGSRRCSFGWSF